MFIVPLRGAPLLLAITFLVDNLCTAWGHTIDLTAIHFLSGELFLLRASLVVIHGAFVMAACVDIRDVKATHGFLVDLGVFAAHHTSNVVRVDE